MTSVAEGIQNVNKALKGLKGLDKMYNNVFAQVPGESVESDNPLDESSIIKKGDYSLNDFVSGPLDKEGKRRERTQMIKEVYGLSHGKGKRKKRKKK